MLNNNILILWVLVSNVVTNNIFLDKLLSIVVMLGYKWVVFALMY